MNASLARIKLTVIALAMLGAVAPPVWASYESAVAAYQSGAYETAIGEFESLAESGDERANYYLGLMHKDGKGTVANSVDALGQFICAAFDGSGFGTQAAAWRDQLTALMTGAEIAAANSKAQVCAGQTGAKVGARTGMIEPSDAPSAAASHDRLSNISNTSSASSAGGRTEFGKSPMPQSVPLQIFYFPARATINGAEFFADLFDFEALVRDLRHMADLRNDLFIALFALFWWFLIIKGVLKGSQIGFEFMRGVGPTGAGRSDYDKPWQS